MVGLILMAVGLAQMAFTFVSLRPRRGPAMPEAEPEAAYQQPEEYRPPIPFNRDPFDHDTPTQLDPRTRRPDDRW